MVKTIPYLFFLLLLLILFFLLSLRYAVLRDPAGWLSVNPVRGTVNTSASLDRESPYVHDNKYTAVFVATDNGKSQMRHKKMREVSQT